MRALSEWRRSFFQLDDGCFVGFQFGLDPVEPFDDFIDTPIQAGRQIVASPKATMIGSATGKNGSFHPFHTSESIAWDSRPGLNWF